MNRIGTIGLAMAALVLSGIATAKSSPPVDADEARAEATLAPRSVAPAPNEIKVVKASAKRNAAAPSETETTRDPYAVPLFQQARSLK